MVSDPDPTVWSTLTSVIFCLLPDTRLVTAVFPSRTVSTGSRTRRHDTRRRFRDFPSGAAQEVTATLRMKGTLIGWSRLFVDVPVAFTVYRIIIIQTHSFTSCTPLLVKPRWIFVRMACRWQVFDNLLTLKGFQRSSSSSPLPAQIILYVAHTLTLVIHVSRVFLSSAPHHSIVNQILLITDECLISPHSWFYPRWNVCGACLWCVFTMFFFHFVVVGFLF